MEERASMIAEGRILAGKIRLERPLARGGMGAVWVAHHLKLDAPVAVKFIDPELAASESARARFEREAKAAAQLQSPWVVQVQDYGVEGDTPYIIMELLVGEDLGQRLQKRGRLTLAEAAPILDQVCKALRRAHEIGLVHRDLKPGNIFLARQDEDEIVKLLDFGIAKSIAPGTPQSGDVTRSGNLVGSPLYMSPEQIRRSKEVDHRSDLWSLAVILYQALTGHPPFVEDEVGAVLVAICTDPIPAPSKVVPNLGPEVDAFFERALARDPAKRFQSAREIYEAFAMVALGVVPGRKSHPEDSARGRAGASGAKGEVNGLAETAPAVPALNGQGAPRSKRSLGLAETEPAIDAQKQGGPDGTLSPAGVTQEPRSEPARRMPRPVLAAAALLVAVAAGGAWFKSATSSDPSANDLSTTVKEDKPGSPTLPLPPPVAEPSAEVKKPPATKEAIPVSAQVPATGPTATEPAAAVSPEAHAASAPPQREKAPSMASTTASTKRDRTASTGAKSKPAGAAPVSTADDAKELGLE